MRTQYPPEIIKIYIQHALNNISICSQCTPNIHPRYTKTPTICTQHTPDTNTIYMQYINNIYIYIYIQKIHRMYH